MATLDWDEVNFLENNALKMCIMTPLIIKTIKPYLVFVEHQHYTIIELCSTPMYMRILLLSIIVANNPLQCNNYILCNEFNLYPQLATSFLILVMKIFG
jgi:hypothetical protein